MSYSPSSSASDVTLTLTPTLTPTPTGHHLSASPPSSAAASGMASALAPSHAQPALPSSSRSSVRFRPQASRSPSRSTAPPAMAPFPSSSAVDSPSPSSSSFAHRSALQPASKATATMINPVMAAMSAAGSTLIPRPAASRSSGSGDRPGSHRKRSSSIVAVQKIEQSQEELLDQAAGFNANADWVNYKGAWVIHVVLILLGKILLDVVPGMRQDASWTIVNLGYIAISYLMFHHVTGTPFDSNAGAYDHLTLWEQIDEGAQYTPAKKWLTSVPIGVFLISTHYTKYNLGLFALNFGATFFVLLPKLPLLHRLRFKVFPGSGPAGGISGTNSPYPSRPNTPAAPY